MTELPPVLSALILLAEELEDRLSEINARLEALQAETTASLEARHRIAARLDALAEELRGRAIGQGLLPDTEDTSYDDPAAIIERIKEAVADDGRVTSPEIISLESWRRAQENRHRRKSEPLPSEAESLDVDRALPIQTLEETLDSVLASLSLSEERVVRATYGYGNGFDDGRLKGTAYWLQRVVASRLGTSQSDVSRKLRKAKAKLKHPYRSRHLRRYHDKISRGEISRAEAIVVMIFGGYNE